MKTCVIFGGAGFIGTFFAKHLIDSHQFSRIYIFDNEKIKEKKVSFREEIVHSYNQIVVIQGDVRQPIEWIPNEEIDLIANFAAVHREPGHKDYEYFECNILGAENVCKWAEKINCKNVIFSSSISPYGPSEDEKDESSIPTPQTAYGSSKLAAEKIHCIWQGGNGERNLIIVRPGVVFGPGEGGNVTRLINAVLKNYFFYTGNKKTRKAGIYVKELCRAIMWVLNRNETKEKGVVLFNMTMNPGPSVEEYVNSISKVAKKRALIPSVPSFILFAVASLIDFIAKPLGINHPFSPVRIKKLTKSNNIIPTFLVNSGYQYQYTLDEAFQDWKNESPDEWK